MPLTGDKEEYMDFSTYPEGYEALKKELDFLQTEEEKDAYLDAFVSIVMM